MMSQRFPPSLSTSDWGHLDDGLKMVLIYGCFLVFADKVKIQHRSSKQESGV